ncbi:hypothetical protein ACA910_014928 [Epithemia clementina (nom. ined.)]
MMDSSSTTTTTTTTTPTGLIAALLAPLLSVVGVMIWDHSWIGGSPFALNMYKCNMASIGFLILTLWTTNHHHPPNSSSSTMVETSNDSSITSNDMNHVDIDDDDEENSQGDRTTMAMVIGGLLVSSTLGILIGDWAWLEGLRLLGARKVIVVDCLKPFLAAVLGHVVLGEPLGGIWAMVGLFLTALGVLLVALEQEQRSHSHDNDDDEDEDGDKEDVAVAETENRDHKKKDGGGQGGIDETLPLLQQPTNLSNNTENKNGGPSQKVLLEQQQSTNSTTSSFSYAETRLRQQQQSLVKQNDEEGSTTPKQNQHKLQLAYGLFVAIINVVFHSFGALLTKSFGRSLSTWQINLVRFGFAGLVLLGISVSMHLWTLVYPKSTFSSPSSSMPPTETNTVHSPLDQPHIESIDVEVAPWFALPFSTMNAHHWLRVSLGVLFVTFLGPTLINYALFQIPFALLLTLESIGPLYSLPISVLLWVIATTTTTSTTRRTTTTASDRTIAATRMPLSVTATIGAAFAVAGIALFAYHTTTTNADALNHHQQNHVL